MTKKKEPSKRGVTKKKGVPPPSKEKKRRSDSTRLKAHNKSCGDGCKEVKDESVDLAIFSPPYKVKDGWTTDLMRALGDTLYRVLKPGARAYMVFGQLKEGFARPWHSAELIQQGSQHAAVFGGGAPLEIVQTIVWAKSLAMGGWNEKCGLCGEKTEVPLLQRGHYQPLNPESPILNYGYEYIFGFRKPGPERLLDRLGIGVPFADKSNLTRGGRGKNGDLHCAGDVWYIPYETKGGKNKKHHRHQFPMELARRLIVLNQLEKGSLIFDPFLGGGTTAVASRLSGMSCVGYELNPMTIEIARLRFEENKEQRWVLAGAKL